jgi:hypothetical protein
MSIYTLSRAGQSMCDSLQPHTHNFCLDIFKLLISPPLVFHDTKLFLSVFFVHLQEGDESFHPHT